MSDLLKLIQTKIDKNACTLTENSILLTSVFDIFNHWALNNHESRILIGTPSLESFVKLKWKDVKTIGEIPERTMERIRHILSIYNALKYIYSDKNTQHEWIKKPNYMYNNKSPLHEILIYPEMGLSAIRTDLESELGLYSA